MAYSCYYTFKIIFAEYGTSERSDKHIVFFINWKWTSKKCIDIPTLLTEITNFCTFFQKNRIARFVLKTDNAQICFNAHKTYVVVPVTSTGTEQLAFKVRNSNYYSSLLSDCIKINRNKTVSRIGSFTLTFNSQKEGKDISIFKDFRSYDIKKA